MSARLVLVLLLRLAFTALQQALADAGALEMDDECTEEGCSWNALQVRAGSSGQGCGRGTECPAGYACHVAFMAHAGECLPAGSPQRSGEGCVRDSDCESGLSCVMNSMDVQVCTEKWGNEIKWMHDPSYCLSADGNRVGNGVHLQMWKCAGSSGQLWDLDQDSDYRLRVRLHEDPSYCVSVDGNRFRNGAKMQLWKCHDEEQNQAWVNWANDRCQGCGRLSPKPTNENMCMVIDNNRAYNGAKVQMWKCAHEDKYQSWQWF